MNLWTVLTSYEKKHLVITFARCCRKRNDVLVSSHNLRELEDVCDHVGIMFNGKLVLEKQLDDVKGEIHKLQIAFKDGVPQEFKDSINILHESYFG